MLRQSLAALSVASLPFVLHAGIFRGDEVLSLLNNVYSPLQAVYTALTGLGCLFYVLFSPCLHSIFGKRTFAVCFVALCIILGGVKRDMDENLLLQYSERNLSAQEYNLQSKVVLVTGANSGVGLGAAQAMHKLGATVIMACRSKAKCRNAADQINERGGKGLAVPMVLDLASFDSVRRFCRSFREKYPRIDIAFFNAGFAAPPRSGKNVTEEGYELGLGTMHFGHFILYDELRETILNTAKEGNDVRVVMTSSAASQVSFAQFDDSLFDEPPGDIHGEKTTVHSQYPRSKLANVLFARRLQQLESSITACSCHVGAVDTNIWAAGGPFVQSIIDNYTKATMRSIEEGTRTMLKCALSKSPSIVRAAAYLDGMGVVVDDKSLHPPSKNDTLAKRLWDISERIARGEESI